MSARPPVGVADAIRAAIAALDEGGLAPLKWDMEANAAMQLRAALPVAEAHEALAAAAEQVAHWNPDANHIGQFYAALARVREAAK